MYREDRGWPTSFKKLEFIDKLAFIADTKLEKVILPRDGHTTYK